MNHLNKYKYIILSLLLSALFILQSMDAKAQYDRSLTFLPALPQGRNINPGYIPDYKFYIGVPFLSSVKTGFENSINYEDIFLRKGDSLILDRDHILNNVDKKTNININVMEAYLSFGFKWDKNYFHFRIADMVESNVVVDRSFLRFMLYGNGSSEFLGKTVNIGGEVFNMNYYREYSLGYSRQINDKLSVGTNLKYLQGIANITTAKSDLHLYTDPEDFALSVRTDFEINMSIPGIDESDIEVSTFLPNADNKGFAFDLGAKYVVNEKYSAFASLLNMGSIKWKTNLKNFKTGDPNKEFTYDGFDITEYFEDNEFDSDRISEIVDSILDEFDIRETALSYRSKLVPVLNFGGRYYLTANDEFSLLARTKFIKNGNWTSVTLAYTRLFARNINLMFSNTFFKNSYLNPGVGFAANAGPVQFYLISENIVAPFVLTKTNIFVVRFGFNLIFWERENELPVDKIEMMNDIQ